MKQIEKISENKTYTAINIGSLDRLMSLNGSKTNNIKNT
jgi:hypothetical protein